jgi:FkbM family methyltransferase
VGANIGAITVPLARKAGLVFAIEPQLQTYYALCGNLAMNSVGHKARAMNVAAGEERGCIQVPMLDLCRPVNVGGLSLGNHAAPETACETVAILPIDDLSLPQCRLLKVDVEGMELEVLKGAARTIERCQPILYVENDREDKSAALIEHIKGLGYQVYDHQPWLSSAENHNGVAVDLFPGIVSINLLCFPPGMPPGDVVQRMKRV